MAFHIPETKGLILVCTNYRNSLSLVSQGWLMWRRIMWRRITVFCNGDSVHYCLNNNYWCISSGLGTWSLPRSVIFSIHYLSISLTDIYKLLFTRSYMEKGHWPRGDWIGIVTIWIPCGNQMVAVDKRNMRKGSNFWSRSRVWSCMLQWTKQNKEMNKFATKLEKAPSLPIWLKKLIFTKTLCRILFKLSKLDSWAYFTSSYIPQSWEYSISGTRYGVFIIKLVFLIRFLTTLYLHNSSSCPIKVTYGWVGNLVSYINHVSKHCITTVCSGVTLITEFTFSSYFCLLHPVYIMCHPV